LNYHKDRVRYDTYFAKDFGKRIKQGGNAAGNAIEKIIHKKESNIVNMKE